MAKRQAWNVTTKRLISRLNRVRFTRKQLLKFFDEVNRLPEDRRGTVGRTFVAARLHKNNPEKARALVSHIEAMANLLRAKELPGWSLPKQADGSIPLDDEIFAAAAVEPLIEGGKGRPAFERESFKRRVLELADLKQQG